MKVRTGILFHQCCYLSSLFPNCIQKARMFACLSQDFRFQKPRPILLSDTGKLGSGMQTLYPIWVLNNSQYGLSPSISQFIIYFHRKFDFTLQKNFDKLIWASLLFSFNVIYSRIIKCTRHFFNLDLQHTDLCFDYCSPDPLQYQILAYSSYPKWRRRHLKE